MKVNFAFFFSLVLKSMILRFVIFDSGLRTSASKLANVKTKMCDIQLKFNWSCIIVISVILKARMI